MRIACVLACVGVLLSSACATVSLAADAPKQPAAVRLTSEQLRRMSDAQLEALAARYDGDAQRYGLELLNADSERDAVTRQLEAAQVQLSEWVAQAYVANGSNSSAVAQIMSGGLANVADSLRVLRAVRAHRASIVAALEDAQARVEMTELRRAELIRAETAAQSQLHRVTDEQDRRFALRQAAEDKRARAAAIKNAEAQDAARTQAALVGGGGLVALGGFGRTAAGSVSPQMLDQYLASKGSPMAGQGAAFVQSGMRWRVDPRLLVAIAGAESNFGNITCGPHNAWGWACPNDPADFGTWADGIDTVTRGLRNYYLDEGRTSVALIQQKYCPVGAANDPTGLNNHWLGNVTRYLEELGGSPRNVGPGPTAGSMVPDIGGLGLLGD